MTTDEKELLALHISNITRQEANKIAEILGNGAVVWDSGKCYPARNIKLELKRRIEQPSERELSMRVKMLTLALSGYSKHPEECIPSDGQGACVAHMAYMELMERAGTLASELLSARGRLLLINHQEDTASIDAALAAYDKGEKE